jgi:hypothetical protein
MQTLRDELYLQKRRRLRFFRPGDVRDSDDHARNRRRSEQLPDRERLCNDDVCRRQSGVDRIALVHSQAGGMPVAPQFAPPIKMEIH